MDLSAYKNIIVFGGSFDPPHLAHVRLPMMVCRKLGAQVVAYVPAARAPHKLDQEQPPAPAHHRLAMLRLALADVEQATMLTDEIDRAADGLPSYTVDTLARLRRRLHADAVVSLLIGADQIRIFNTWKDPQRIVQLAKPIVMVRPPDTARSLLSALENDAERAKWRDRLIELPAMDVSSTQLRKAIAAGQPTDDMLHPQVAQYIAAHGLYRV